jgi:hypothetical protein
MLFRESVLGAKLILAVVTLEGEISFIGAICAVHHLQ